MIQFPSPGLSPSPRVPRQPQAPQPPLLGDLGKPTMRGIRKCPKCGTYNGTRGLSCKNKQCDMVFKEADHKSRTRCVSDCVKLYTGTTASIYSVRLRDRGPDYRGFVQLPTVEGLSLGTESLEGEAALLVQSASLCFVDSCTRSTTAVGSSPEQLSAVTACPHITACMGVGVGEATPVMLRHSAMNDLDIRTEIKQEG